jgi:hypothetical protein
VERRGSAIDLFPILILAAIGAPGDCARLGGPTLIIVLRDRTAAAYLGMRGVHCRKVMIADQGRVLGEQGGGDWGLQAEVADLTRRLMTARRVQHDLHQTAIDVQRTAMTGTPRLYRCPERARCPQRRLIKGESL